MVEEKARPLRSPNRKLEVEKWASTKLHKKRKVRKEKKRRREEKRRHLGSWVGHSVSD